MSRGPGGRLLPSGYPGSMMATCTRHLVAQDDWGEASGLVPMPTTYRIHCLALPLSPWDAPLSSSSRDSHPSLQEIFALCSISFYRAICSLFCVLASQLTLTSSSPWVPSSSPLKYPSAAAFTGLITGSYRHTHFQKLYHCFLSSNSGGALSRASP